MKSPIIGSLECVPQYIHVMINFSFLVLVARETKQLTFGSNWGWANTAVVSRKMTNAFMFRILRHSNITSHSQYTYMYLKIYPYTYSPTASTSHNVNYDRNPQFNHNTNWVFVWDVRFELREVEMINDKASEYVTTEFVEDAFVNSDLVCLMGDLSISGIYVSRRRICLSQLRMIRVQLVLWSRCYSYSGVSI